MNLSGENISVNLHDLKFGNAVVQSDIKSIEPERKHRLIGCVIKIKMFVFQRA